MGTEHSLTQHHGSAELRGHAMCPHAGGTIDGSRFGRLFKKLPGTYTDPAVLADLGRAGGPMDGGTTMARTDTVALGQVFFGQFIDHDVTLDTTSSLGAVNDPAAIENERTPALDLDCVYGDGPEGDPFLYDGPRLLTGADADASDPLVANDLLRNPLGRALIGDPRNDENRVVSQLQLGMIRFHNAMVDDVEGEGALATEKEIFEEARRRTTWHYQWVVVNDFLPAMCGRYVVDQVLAHGRQWYRPKVPMIPVEFSVAAYRFGHSMAPMDLRVQAGDSFALFGDVLGRGFAAIEDERAIVQWDQLLDVGTDNDHQRADKLDTKMASALLELPAPVDPERRSLATRNLLRGNSFRLPAGDDVALAMGREEAEIELVRTLVAGMSADAPTSGIPLWLYLLAEAEVIGRETVEGATDAGEGLGPVGARLVAEVIIGLIETDPRSWLSQDRNWSPHPDHDTLGKILQSVTPVYPPVGP